MKHPPQILWYRKFEVFCFDKKKIIYLSRIFVAFFGRGSDGNREFSQ